ncbi:MAG: hypothetical protein J3K34DRAFT_441720 [Monoraphidium minutum]|nr:MAG: hypothetical protein J3K34DRAFT_441720 [Monoraphidium minutum]
MFVRASRASAPCPALAPGAPWLHRRSVASSRGTPLHRARARPRPLACLDSRRGCAGRRRGRFWACQARFGCPVGLPPSHPARAAAPGPLAFNGGPAQDANPPHTHARPRCGLAGAPASGAARTRAPVLFRSRARLRCGARRTFCPFQRTGLAPSPPPLPPPPLVARPYRARMAPRRSFSHYQLRSLVAALYLLPSTAPDQITVIKHDSNRRPSSRLGLAARAGGPRLMWPRRPAPGAGRRPLAVRLLP